MVHVKDVWMYYAHLLVSFVEWHEPVWRKERATEATASNEQENDACQPL